MRTGRMTIRAPQDDEPLVGVTLDGWLARDRVVVHRSELLLLAGHRRRCVGRLAPLPSPPVERGRPEPWRMAVATLFMLGATSVPRRLRRYPAAPLLTALRCGLDCAFTDVAGAFFDAAAGLLGIDSAAQLEMLAERNGPEEPLPWGYRLASDGELDLLPLLEDLVEMHDAPLGAALFHATFAEAIAAWVRQVCAPNRARRVALAGDCFENRVLAQALGARLLRAGYEVYAPFTQSAEVRAALRGVRAVDLEASA